MANWLDKYEQGGLVLKKKTKDNYGKKANPNDIKASVGPDFVGLGYNTKGRDYSPAWGGQFQDGGKLTLPEAIVYGHKDPSTKAYFNKVRAIAENYQDKNFWLSPLAGYHTLEQMHSKYGAPKINTIGEDDRAHYEPFTDVMNIPNPTKFNGGNETMDIFLEELAHKVQKNKKGIIGISTKQLTKDYLNTLKNIDSSDIFTKQGWIDAYEKNYTTPGTLENEAHSVISPKLKEEYRDIRSKNFDRLHGDMAMGGALPGSVGFTYARVAGSAPANGKYTKKTKASAQDGKVLSPDADDRSILGFRTSDPAFQNVKSNAFVPFDPNNFEGIRQNIAGYMSSPLYMDRLSKSIPDAENAKDTQQRRLNNLLSIKLNPKTVNEGTNYNRNQNRINLDATDFIDNAAISHEIAHGIVPNLTTSYGKQNMFAKAANVVGDLFQPFEQFSNSELEKINRPLSGKITAPNFDYMMARKEEHYKPQGSKASAKTAANETYGDLTGMRQLLLDNGITTEFGQDLTPEIFKKATENKRVMNSPAFKRMKLKFKDEDIIKMNNEVAMNDNKKDIPQAQLGIGLIPYVTSAAANIAASIPTMEEVKGKAIDVIKNSPKLRKAINKGISYVANTDWGKEKIKNFANNIDPHGYGNGYLRDMTTRSPFDRIYSAAILNKKEDSRKEMDSLLAAGKADPGDSLRVDLINQYAGLPQKYNTVKPSAYKPTMGNKNDKYYSSPIIERQLLSDLDLVAGNLKMKPEFKTKQDLQNFVQKHFGGEKGKGDNYVTPIEGLGTATTGVGEDEKGIYLSYYDNWDLNPYHGNYADSDNSFEATNDKLGRAILGNEKENIATKKIGTPTQMYGRIYFDKKTGKPKMQNGGEMSFYQNGLDFKPKSISKNGSVIKDDRGQWAHPGEVTEIDSNYITMQGVDYPVLGISDTGDTQMMYPDQDYKFDGEKVTEFPMMEKGGWLDKYKAQGGKSLAPYGSLQGDLPIVTVTSSKPSKWGKFKFAPYDPSKNPESISQWNPKPGEREAMAAAEQARKDEENSFYNNKHIKALRNSAFADWRPYALAGGLTALPAIGSALGLGSTSTAMSTPMVAGITANHLLGAAAVTHGINKLPETSQSVRTAYNNPTSENIINAINDVGWNALDLAPAVPTLSKIGTEAKGVYNTVATGESALPIAWKSSAKGLGQEASDAMFEGIANTNKLSDADRALLLEYQYDSKPFTGRWGTIDQSKKDALNNAINNNELTINNNAILTRRFNPENQSLGAEFVGNKLNLGDRPSSFSAGVGLPSYQSGAVDRLVIPNRYAKQMGNEFLANEYGIPSDKTFDLLKGKSKDWAASIGVNPTDMVNAEREVIGTGLDLRRIGRVKNDIGGYDHIVRPITINKSTGTQSVTRGPINWWESPTFKKNNPNYDPTKPPLNPFPKYTAENVPEELNPYLVIDDTPDDPFSYTELDEGLPSIGSALGLSNNVNTNVEAIDAIRKGENYVKNWMYNQEIQKRIQQGNLEILSENHPGFYKSKVSDLYTPNSTAAGIEQKMGDLTPISYSEINRIKEANESNPLIDKLSGLYKGLYFPNNNKAFVKYEKGLSNAADLEATAAHETAHNLQYNRLSKKSNFIDNSPQIYSKKETELLQSPFEFPKSETNYNLDEEIHSRIFEIRNRLGLKPDTKFTKDMLPEAMKVSNGLDRFIKDKDAFIKLMNNIWMVAPVAVGVGAAASSSDKKQNGGWLNKYK